MFQNILPKISNVTAIAVFCLEFNVSRIKISKIYEMLLLIYGNNHNMFVRLLESPQF